MATRAIFYDGVRKHLTSQPLQPAAIEVNLWEGDSATREHTLLRVANKRDSYGGKLIVRVNNTNLTDSTKYELVTMTEDGNPTDFDLETTSAGVPLLFDVSPDETSFLVLHIDKDATGTNDEAWIHRLDSQLFYAFTAGAIVNDNALDMRYAPNGTIVVKHATDGWHYFSADGTRNPNVIVDSSYSWVGAKGSFFYLNVATGLVNDFIAARPVDETIHNVNAEATSPYPVFRGDGVILYVDDSQQAWSAIFSPTTNLFEHTLIDGVTPSVDPSVATTQIYEVGDGPGNRTFLLMDRAPAAGSDEVVVYDVVNRSTPAEALLPDVVKSFFVAD